MDDVHELLKRMDARLDRIEQVVLKPGLREKLEKSHYSCTEVAELTQDHGSKKYKPFTVRLACNQGRIRDAEKTDSGAWLIPRDAVLRIVSEGIPPERRDRGGGS